MKRHLLLFPLILIVIPIAMSRDVVGEIVYLEGNPEITRGGDLVADSVDFGFPIENLDSIRTDAVSVAELELDPRTGVDATIFIDVDTEFHLGITGLKSEQTATIDLIAGSLNVAARELLGVSRLNVQTRTASAGVRGTTFSVTTAVGGEILVSAEEGLVEVTDPDGFTLFAAPGEAVEIDAERNVFRNLKYSGATAALRLEWRAERLETFRANAPRIFRYHARRYRDERQQFVGFYRDLMRERGIIDRWIEESRRGSIGDPADLARDLSQIAEPLFRVRRSMFAYERTLARLERMKPFVIDLAGDIELEEGSGADLLRLADRDRAVMRRRFAAVRHVIRLYSDRAGGDFPGTVVTVEEESTAGEDAN